VIRSPCVLCAALLLATALDCSPAHGDDANTSGQLRDLCVDRPGKGTSPCTVDVGHFQIEADIFNGTFERQDGVSTRTYFFANPTFKFGVNDNLDIEVNIAPLVQVMTKDETTGASTTLTGIGDLFLRAKFDIFGNGVGNFGLVVEPYVKIPTARGGIGDGALEGGALAPMALDLGDSWSLSATPEIDILKNAEGEGRHFALSTVVGLGRSVGGGVSLGAELWALTDFDPDGDTRQYSFDVAAAWQPAADPDLQFDGGVNFGLNGATPGVQVYIGVSRRL
jgi:hypothetical protein